MRREQTKIFLPLVASAVLFILYYVVILNPLASEYQPNIEKALYFAAFVPLIFVLVRLFDAFVFEVFVTRRRGGMPAPRLLRDIIALLLYFTFFAFVVNRIYGVNIGRALLAGTVLAAILGLALQETLGNLFSGIALHMEDTFEVGDVVKSGDRIGVVEGLNWRATRIRTFSGNSILIMPNSLLARESLEVFPRGNLNARIIQVGIDYSTPPAKVIEVLTHAAQNVDGVGREIPCFARVGSFGDSSVVYEIKYFTREYHNRDRIDADVKKAIWYALRRNEISIPFPIRSFQPYRPPKQTQGEPAPEDIGRRLSEVELFGPLSAEVRAELAGAARVHDYSRGESIIRHGTAGDSMFVVHNGTVSVRIADSTTSELREVVQLGAGSVFGEMALLTGETRTADVVALTDVTAIEIRKDDLQPILVGHPELAMAFSRNVTERRSRLHEMQADSPEEEEKTIRSRILAYFGM